jgi:hypothetical protein
MTMLLSDSAPPDQSHSSGREYACIETAAAVEAVHEEADTTST